MLNTYNMRFFNLKFKLFKQKLDDRMDSKYYESNYELLLIINEKRKRNMFPGF